MNIGDRCKKQLVDQYQQQQQQQQQLQQLYLYMGHNAWFVDVKQSSWRAATNGWAHRLFISLPVWHLTFDLYKEVSCDTTPTALTNCSGIDRKLTWMETLKRTANCSENVLKLSWNYSESELKSNWKKSPRKSSQMLWNYLVIALKPPCNHLVTPFALGLLGNCSENPLQSNPRERVAKLPWNYFEIAPKLIQNYSETPPNLFQNCSRTALKTFPGKCTNIAPKLLQNCNNC